MSAPTLWGETCSTFRATRFDNTSSATGLHTGTKTMGSGALYITGLECTLHVKRLGSLFVAFNKARQCTVTTASRQYINHSERHTRGTFISPSLHIARIAGKAATFFRNRPLRELWISIILRVGRDARIQLEAPLISTVSRLAKPLCRGKTGEAIDSVSRNYRQHSETVII